MTISQTIPFSGKRHNKTYNNTVLDGIPGGMYPVALHLTFIRVLSKGTHLHLFGQTLSHVTASLEIKVICMRKQHVATEPIAIRCKKKKNMK